MTDINLVPEQLRRKKKKELIASGIPNVPKEVVVGIGGGLLVLVFSIHCFMLLIMMGKFVHLQSYKGQWASILPDKNNLDSVSQQLRDLQKKTNSIQEILRGEGISWPRELNTISDAIPRGVWLRKMTLQEKVMLIEGTTVSKEQNEMVNVGSFVANLKKDEDFMRHCDTIEVDYIQRRKSAALDVADFTIMAKLK